MDDSGSGDPLKKLVIVKANHQWFSTIKTEGTSDVKPAADTTNFSLDYGNKSFPEVKSEVVDYDDNIVWQDSDLLVETIHEPYDDNHVGRIKKPETDEGRASRLAKMSAYSARRLANESPEQRASRLKRMSEYAAKRLANETSEQRAKRLARMSAYAAKRLSQEPPDKRKERLARMSAYAAKRHALKKQNTTNIPSSSSSNCAYD